jgi:hypothetical protein
MILSPLPIMSHLGKALFSVQNKAELPRPGKRCD